METPAPVARTLCVSLLAALSSMTTPTCARADDSPRWLLRAGLTPVQAKPRGHSAVRVDDGVALTFAGTCMLSPHWGVELLSALPVKHDIRLESGGRIATVNYVPPTLSVQYRFAEPGGRLQAYVGAGLNYTLFFNEHTTGAWAGSDLEFNRSFGPAAQAGLEMNIGRTWFAGLDARWFDIDTRARVNGNALGTVALDPYAIGLTIGRRLR